MNLRALQTFNAVAKTKNLTRAAEKLGVTQGAVSHQVRALEQAVGFQLLERHASGVSLTERGQRLFLATEPAFEMLETGLSNVTRRVRKHSLTISLPTALATKWLVPRLAIFKQHYPNIDIFLDTTDDLIDFETSEVDAAIRFVCPHEGSYHMTKIRDEMLVAVVSPQLMSRVKETTPDPTIEDFPILEDTFDPRWDEWLRLSGQGSPHTISNTVKFTDSAVLIAAAVNGQGVALARRIMVEDDIAEGRLELFSKVEIKLQRQLLLLCREAERNAPGINALRRWLLTL